MEVFEYRQKPRPKIFALAVFIFIAFVLIPHSPAKTSIEFWAACAATQVLLIQWFASRRIVVDEQGIRVVVLWTLTARFVSWEQMEESSLISIMPTRRSALIARATPKLAGPTVDELVLKVIVSNAEALYVHLGDLKDGSAFADLVVSRVRFVR